MSAAQLPVTWRPRPQPLVAVAVAAQGEAARALGRRLLELDDEALPRLHAVAGEGVLVALATDGAELPWVDGARYLGRDPDAPSLLLPTNALPSVPLALLDEALRARAAGAGLPLAVLHAPPLLVPLRAARPTVRRLLAAWLERR